MPLNTIDEVLSALDAIIQRAWEEKSRIGYFATLYRRITRAVRDGVSRRQFSDCPLIEKLDVTFAGRYLDALNAFQSQGKPSRCWHVAFHACTDDSRLILQHLLAGINAHINLDLGIASAQVSPGDQLPKLKPDFDEINALLAAQVGAVEDELSALSPLIKTLSQVGLKTETSIINFNIDVAREAAWSTAERLTREPAILNEVTVDGLDLAVSLKGRSILYPLLKDEVLAPIRAQEVQDVRTVIETLARDPASSPASASSDSPSRCRP